MRATSQKEINDEARLKSEKRTVVQMAWEQAIFPQSDYVLMPFRGFRQLSTSMCGSAPLPASLSCFSPQLSFSAHGSPVYRWHLLFVCVSSSSSSFSSLNVSILVWRLNAFHVSLCIPTFYYKTKGRERDQVRKLSCMRHDILRRWKKILGNGKILQVLS